MHIIETALLNHFNQCCLRSSQSNSQTSLLTQNDSLIIAFSGGLDSSVLLFAAIQLYRQNKIPNLAAAHVNHGLQSSSNDWQNHCQQQCDSYQIACYSKQLNLSQLNKTSEEDARNGRYQFFKELVEDGQTMAFAHHLNDQVETLLFRLFRGTGIHGMSGIPASRKLFKGQLIRPLLDFSREQLKAYAVDNKLQWIEDPSNQSSQYHRNFIRNKVVPLIQTKWPKASNSIANFSLLAKEQVSILDEVAKEDLNQIELTPKTLCLEKLIKLSIARQKNLLHFWIKKKTASPTNGSDIEELIKQLGLDTEDNNSSDSELKQKQIEIKISSGFLRSYNGELYFCHQQEPVALTEKVDWDDLKENLQLDNGVELTAEFSNENTLQIRLPKENEKITVRPRVGGEVAHPFGRNHSTDLKKIYQELKVPPWQRKWLPIIYYNDQIVAVPNVFVDQCMWLEGDDVGFSVKFD